MEAVKDLYVSVSKVHIAGGQNVNATNVVPNDGVEEPAGTVAAQCWGGGTHAFNFSGTTSHSRDNLGVSSDRTSIELVSVHA